jgi:hypothetical protein
MTPVVKAGRDVVSVRYRSVVFLSVNNSKRSLSVSDEGTASISVLGGEIVDISPELVDYY